MNKAVIAALGEVAYLGIGLLTQDKMASIEEDRRKNAFAREVKATVLGCGLDVAANTVDIVSNAVMESGKRKTESVKSCQELKRIDQKEKIFERRMKFEKEMEELEKDRELQRRKDILATLQNYQIEVTKTVKESMMILAGMPLDLQERANSMLLEEQERFEQFRQKCVEDAMKNLDRIQASFVNNERVQKRMEDMLMDGMEEMLKAAEDTVKRISQNISDISENARMLSQKGQAMVESRINSMQIGGTVQYLADKDQSF